MDPIGFWLAVPQLLCAGGGLILNDVFGEDLLPGGGGSENEELRESPLPRDMPDMELFMPPMLMLADTGCCVEP